MVVWPEPSSDGDEQDARGGLHWKTRALVAWAAGRPFVWVDDELTDRDRAWVAAHHPGRALLHRVDARLGLTGGDYEALGSWLRQLSEPGGTARRRLAEDGVAQTGHATWYDAEPAAEALTGEGAQPPSGPC